MRIELDLTHEELSELLIAISKVVQSLEPVGRCYHNPTNIGPRRIPKDLSDGKRTLEERVQSREKIWAIKILRENYSLSLKDAKDIVDHIFGDA